MLETKQQQRSERVTSLAQRTFSIDDQRRFAAVSGDHNPMHMDALAARRTQAGAPVVHGIHLLLWTLESLARSLGETQSGLPVLRGIQVHFSKFVYVDEPAEVVLNQTSATRARLSVNVDGGVRSKFTVELGESNAVAPDLPETLPELTPFLPHALPLTMEEIANRAGRLAFGMTAEDAAALFPSATAWIGVSRVQALAATTHLIGMVCPGLHSIFSELALKAAPPSGLESNFEGLLFEVSEIDPRFGLIQQEIAANGPQGGWVGTASSFLRTPPVQQATMQSLAGVVAPEEFAGATALIVGGSRGLGELTAKIIATGGGRVYLTWHSGKDDAQRVVDEIRSCGGEAEALQYDTRLSAVEQLASIGEPLTHAYYFATPAIFRPQADLYTAGRMAEFMAVYVDGFWKLAQALRARLAKVSLFYPSSVAVDERPAGMTEYTMAKVAGECLCADISAWQAPTRVTISRLPRLPTDQTASVTAVETERPLDVMLPIVRRVQAHS